MAGRDNRDTVEKVLSAWRQGQFRGAGNMGTDGVYVYSYSEPIASTVAEGPNKGDVLVLVSGEFSRTTSKHCSQVASSCSRVHRVPQDCVKTRSLTPTPEALAAYQATRNH
jgi:hypothetical protein